jgi:hypothetical protein
MSTRTLCLKPDVSVETGSCAICKEHGRHSAHLPVSLRGAVVCDDCAHSYAAVCDCCEAGISIEDVSLL